MRQHISSFFTELFSERGKVSTIRIMSLWCLLIGSIIAIYGVMKDKNVNELVAIFLGTAVAGKVSHKFAETKKDKE